MYASVISFFQDGGTFMYPIMIVLAIGLAITLERYLYITAAKRSNSKLLKQLLPMLQDGWRRGTYRSCFSLSFLPASLEH